MHIHSRNAVFSALYRVKNVILVPLPPTDEEPMFLRISIR